jgi:membrane-associated protease RseP (regulator of RpoE activity)
MFKSTLNGSLFLVVIISMSLAVAQSHPTFNTQQIKSPIVKQSAWLGIWIENVPIALGKHLSPMLQENQGVLVARVHENSPAQTAGLQQYDVIAQLNDQKIFSSQQLSQLVNNAKIDSKMTIHYIHQGKLNTKDVVLTLKPQQAFSQRIRPNKVQPILPRGFDPFNYPRFNFRDFPDKLQKQSKTSSWSEFESLLIQTTEADKYKVSVSYQDSNSNKKQFTFEGNMEQIQQQIKSTNDMDENKKAKLLNALANQGNINKPYSSSFFPGPNWFNQSQQIFPQYIR